MSSVVLDASAILAALLQESGAENVERHAGEAVASAVNVAEAGARISDLGMTIADARQAMDELELDVIPFDAEMAHDSALIRKSTRHQAMSLGDRACLALARRLGLPVLTADQAWAEVDVGVDVQLIRKRP